MSVQAVLFNPALLRMIVGNLADDTDMLAAFRSVTALFASCRVLYGLRPHANVVVERLTSLQVRLRDAVLGMGVGPLKVQFGSLVRDLPEVGSELYSLYDNIVYSFGEPNSDYPRLYSQFTLEELRNAPPVLVGEILGLIYHIITCIDIDWFGGEHTPLLVRLHQEPQRTVLHDKYASVTVAGDQEVVVDEAVVRFWDTCLNMRSSPDVFVKVEWWDSWS
jgi:hypothetical protein